MPPHVLPQRPVAARFPAGPGHLNQPCPGACRRAMAVLVSFHPALLTFRDLTIRTRLPPHPTFETIVPDVPLALCERSPLSEDSLLVR